jgi:hypothetical protein
VTQLSDFVVIDRNVPETTQGKWRSPPFEAGGRNIRTEGGVEKHNAYLLLMFNVPRNAPAGDALIRVIVNGHPLPQLLAGLENSTNTAIAGFPASFLRSDSSNVVELHAQQENSFYVMHAIVHFRQNS